VVTAPTEKNVVFAGFGSVNVAVVQLLGPWLYTVCTYVIWAPAVTGLGLPLLVTVRSQTVLTLVVTDAVAVLTAFVAVTCEGAVIVAAVTLDGTFNTTTILAVSPTAKLGSVQVTVPVPPTAGVVHVHPTGAITDWYVVFAGVASVKLAVVAAAGPLFVTVSVYVMLFPASTVVGAPAAVSTRSACAAPATTSFATAEFAPYDWFVPVTVAVSTIGVAFGVPVFTR
jgi:hypothetical protein